MASLALFGLITGLVAAVVGCIALVLHEPRKKGVGLAAGSIGLGILSSIAWSVGLFFAFGNMGGVAAMNEMRIDFDSFADLPGPINRAMRANVVIERNSLFGLSVGSGVILANNADETLIVTNRHVIDPDFNGGDGSGAIPNIAELPSVMVRAFDSAIVPGRVVWIAPNDIDLALVSSVVSSEQILEATWQLGQKIPIGTQVFAIGNPHGLSWAYTSGDVSQVRKQSFGPTDVRVVQTSAAINPGNSGGGLYSQSGTLVGINTWTKDKRFADGLSFSIAFDVLLELIPGRFNIPDEQNGAAENVDAEPQEKLAEQSASSPETESQQEESP